MCVQFLVKYILFFFNIVFWVAGVALIAVGIAVLTNVRKITDLIPFDLSAIPVAVIVAGCVVFLIAFSGCWGAIREARWLLILYAVFMLILAAGKTYIAWFVLSHLQELPNIVKGWIDDAFQTSLTTAQGSFQIMEEIFQCCGSTGADSYTSLGMFVPATCCPQPAASGACDPGFSYSGCSAKLGEYLESYGQGIGITIIVIIVIELTAMGFALYLNSAITEKNRKRRNVY